jgi:hypothetical protein
MTDTRHTTDRRQASKAHARLLAALLFFHVAAPATQTIAPSLALALLLPLYVIVLGAAALVMSSRRSRLLIVALALPMILATPPAFFSATPEPLILSVSTLPFLIFAAGVVFRSVLTPGAIDRSRLLGAGSVFILLSQVWAGAYSGLELLSPGAFAASSGSPVGPSDLAYLSLVTQTTLGYGDITPTTPIARALATLQAVAGLFYMGVVVARFAGHLELDAAASDDHGERQAPDPSAGRAAASRANHERARGL